MKKSLFAIALAGMALASTAAHAESHGRGHGPNVYGSVGISSSSFQVDGFESFDKRATGGTIALGTQINRNLAVEVAYADYGSRDITMTDGVNLYGASVDSKSYGVYLVASKPITKQLSVFVKPGLVRGEAKIDGAGSIAKTGLDLGVGAEYALNRQVSLVASVNRIGNFTDSDAALTSVNGGVKFRF